MPGRAERTELTPEEVKQAMEEAKSRGLPSGWTVKLDVSWSSLKLGCMFALSLSCCGDDYHDFL